MKYGIKVFFFIVMLGLLSGCMAVPKQNLGYTNKPTFNAPVIHAKKTISKVIVGDKRGGPSDYIGFVTYTETGPHGEEYTVTRVYNAKKPIKDTIAEIANQALKDHGYRISSQSPDYDFKINLVVIKLKKISRMFHSEFSCRLALRAQLQNAKTHRIVWQHKFTSEGRQPIPFFSSGLNDIRDSFHKALNGAIEQLLTSEGFQSLVMQ